MTLNLTAQQKTEISDYINEYRALHQAPALLWNDTIGKFSQSWSLYLLQNKVFKHSGNKLYGENLAYFQGHGTEIMKILKLAVDNWYNEVKSYNFAKPGFAASTGHFTCLVWKSSTSFAMGISIDNTSQTAYITMNTSPPGNYIGQFQQNVLAPVLVPVPVPIPVPVPTPVPTPDPVPVPAPHNHVIDVETKTYIMNALNTITGEIMTDVSMGKILTDLSSLKKYLKNVSNVAVSKNLKVCESNTSNLLKFNPYSYPYGNYPYGGYPYDYPYGYPYGGGYPYYLDPYDRYLHLSSPLGSNTSNNIHHIIPHNTSNLLHTQEKNSCEYPHHQYPHPHHHPHHHPFLYMDGNSQIIKTNQN